MNQSDAYTNLANQRSFYKTKILLHHCALITVQCALPKIVSDKLSKLDSKLSDIWNYFRTMSEGRRQTESLLMIRKQLTALIVG